MDSGDPLNVPYLENPPDVICIDVGRQLFVDDFLIETTTLHRNFGKPRIHPSSPILKPQTEEEMDCGNCPVAAPFNDGVCYDAEDKLFKLWYMPGWFHTTALVTSQDGVHWERPDLDVEPGTNLVWPRRDSYERDGCLVWLDQEGTDRSQRFKMFQYYRFDTGADGEIAGAGWLHTSPDVIHWSQPVTTTTVGDNSSFFYNPYRKKWCMSIRRGSPTNPRARWYHEHDDFLAGATWDIESEEVFWQRTDRLDRPDPARPDHRVALYDLNVVAYESVMLGLFAIFRGPENEIGAEQGLPKINDLELGYSRDGFHFSRPDRTPFLAATRRVGDWNRAYLHAVGGTCVVVHDELYIYFGAFSGQSPNLGPNEKGSPGRARLQMYAGGSTGLAVMRRDGFASMETSEDGSLTTRPVIFKGNRLFVNADTSQGELRVAVLEQDGTPVDGLGADNCVPVCGDSTRCEVSWLSDDISKVAGRPVKLRFDLRAGRLFSFWVTDDPDGASYGHMAAGGPGFTNARDMPARRTRNSGA